MRGRAPRGQRVHAACPAGHWHTTTILGALRLDDSTTCRSIEGAADTAVFDTYIRQVLAPTLRTGDILVLDNLSSHKNEPTLEWPVQAGVEVVFLPPYSPDLNPIEKMWSKVKSAFAAPPPEPQRIWSKPSERICTASRAKTPSTGLPIAATVLFNLP